MEARTGRVATIYVWLDTDETSRVREVEAWIDTQLEGETIMGVRVLDVTIGDDETCTLTPNAEGGIDITD